MSHAITDQRPQPFRRTRHGLGRTGLTLEPLAIGEAPRLGAAFAAIDPWAAYRVEPAQLAAFFARDEANGPRFVVRRGEITIGAVVLHHPWLHGPYLQFLGLLPGAQGAGAGAAVLAWMEAEVAGRARNLWLCVSVINTRAQVFYERHGFEVVASLDALVATGMDEILMRKRLF